MQKGNLTKDQQRQIIDLFTAMGEQGGIFHNDGNVARNMMVDDTTGRMYVRDP